MKFQKKSLTQWVVHHCERQLALSLWEERDQKADSKSEKPLGIPHRQVRPGLQQLTAAGDEWQNSKFGDLVDAFGPTAIASGGPPTIANGRDGRPVTARYPIGDLLTLLSGVSDDVLFVVEGSLQPLTPTFVSTWDLDWINDKGVELQFADLRPDLVQISEAGRFVLGLRPDGTTFDTSDDPRKALRVIDLKLTSAPGPGYFAETTYYALALAAALADAHDLDSKFFVAADAALWPGSHNSSAVRNLRNEGGERSELLKTLEQDLESVPTEVFVAEIRRFFSGVLPRVARSAVTKAWLELPWHVVPKCGGCDYLGQSFAVGRAPKGDGASSPHDNHCVPTAGREGKMFQVPFLPRGGLVMLEEAGHTDIRSLGTLSPQDDSFDGHHSLRGGRALIPRRAQTILDQAVSGIPPGAGTNAIPKWSDLSIYVTADFDPSSAITLAFGVAWSFFPSKFGGGAGSEPAHRRPTLYYTKNKTLSEEQHQLGLLLESLQEAMNAAQAIDSDATVQIYLWDSLTLDHLTRVVGRHLDWLLARDDTLTALAWLFPPEDQVIASAKTVKSPVVSVVSDGVRGTVATSQTHTYTVLDTARNYHTAGFDPNYLSVPPLWMTEFSDQIPGERAFDIWTGRDTAATPHADHVKRLDQTVRARLRALEEVTRRLRDDLKGSLYRTAPKIRALSPPATVPRASMFGNLLYAFTALNGAVVAQNTRRIRALAAHEREAKFEAVRCLDQLAGRDRDEALDTLGLSPDAALRIYRVAPGSTEAKITAGDIGWAVSPEMQPGLLEEHVFHPRTQQCLTGVGWWANRPGWVTTLEDLLEIKVAAFDRQKRLIAIQLEYPDAVNALMQAGHFSLDSGVILDRVPKDFLTKKVKLAVQDLGNPPAAAAFDAEARRALGVSSTRRGAQRSQPTPLDDYLFNPQVVADASTGRDTTRAEHWLADRAEELGRPRLNPSQQDAWQAALTRRLCLIWGPPGTGKSATLRSVIEGLLHYHSTTGTPIRVLLTAQTYTAIDNVLNSLDFSGCPGAVVRRVRSDLRPIYEHPTLLSEADLSIDEVGTSELAKSLREGQDVVLVATTPHQAQKLIDRATGGNAGPAFDHIVIDEAGQLDTPTAIVALAGLAEGGAITLAGDPLQLPPIHQVEPPSELAHLVGPIYSFFERNWSDDQTGSPIRMLEVNYRSNAEIVELARSAGYPDSFISNQPDLRIPTIEAPRGDTDDEQRLHAIIADPERPVICITYPEGVSGQWNDFEAGLTASVASVLAGAWPDDPALWVERIGVVTPHRAQRSLIVERLVALGFDRGEVDRAVDTVDRFQGQERDAIIGSYAVGDPDTIADEEEFLQELNRFNVMATRPKSKLIVILTDELLNHIGSNLEVVRGSRLLKSFATTYCDESAELTLTHRGRRGRSVPLTARWPTSAR